MDTDTIAATLQRFPEVEWDRWSGTIEEMSVFGWIDRDDGRADYMLLSLIDGEPTWFSTSSARYSAEFAERLGWTHDDCQRVEDLVTIPNCVRS